MVAVDLRFLSEAEGRKGECLTSFSIYAAELLDEFERRGLADFFILLIPVHAKKLVRMRFAGYSFICTDYFITTLIRRICSFIFQKRTSLRCWLDERLAKSIFKWKVLANGFRISTIWMPLFTPQYNCLENFKTVLTIHDLMIWENDCKKDVNSPHLMKFKKNIIGCQKIVAVSEFTAGGIRKEFCDAFQKIVVIPQPVSVGIDRESVVNDEIKCRLDKGYILNINGFGSHKNTMSLLKAFWNISDKIELNLVCIGAWAESSYFRLLQDYCKDKGIENRVVFLKGISAEERNYFLRHASLFVTPSLKEGFGRSPVEAAICEVPVISSKSDSLPEATRGLVHYYDDPCNDQELGMMMLNVLKDPDPIKKLQKISKELSNYYDVKRSADMYLDVFGLGKEPEFTPRTV